MTNDNSPSKQSARIGGQAIGALFFSVFGSAWLFFGLLQGGYIWQSAVAMLALPLVTFVFLAMRQIRANREAMQAEDGSPEQKHRSRVFHAVNTGQWVLMIIFGNILSNLGMSQWVVPSIMLIVGLHFFPLARVFRNPAQLVTGIALVAVAVIYPLLTASGPGFALGPIFAGLILWISAAWALRPSMQKLVRFMPAH